jgi:hypothetical protein
MARRAATKRGSRVRRPIRSRLRSLPALSGSVLARCVYTVAATPRRRHYWLSER